MNVEHLLEKLRTHEDPEVQEIGRLLENVIDTLEERIEYETKRAQEATGKWLTLDALLGVLYGKLINPVDENDCTIDYRDSEIRAFLLNKGYESDYIEEAIQLLWENGVIAYDADDTGLITIGTWNENDEDEEKFIVSWPFRIGAVVAKHGVFNHYGVIVKEDENHYYIYYPEEKKIEKAKKDDMSQYFVAREIIPCRVAKEICGEDH